MHRVGYHFMRLPTQLRNYFRTSFYFSIHSCIYPFNKNSLNIWGQGLFCLMGTNEWGLLDFGICSLFTEFTVPNETIFSHNIFWPCFSLPRFLTSIPTAHFLEVNGMKTKQNPMIDWNRSKFWVRLNYQELETKVRSIKREKKTKELFKVALQVNIKTWEPEMKIHISH